VERSYDTMLTRDSMSSSQPGVLVVRHAPEATLTQTFGWPASSVP
jgi:hypothetical protein